MRRGIILEQDADKRVTFDDLRILTKKQELIPFKPNEVQEAYLDEIIPLWREGIIEPQGLREIILKARQFGFSTLIEAVLFLVTINTPNTTTLVVAHDGETTESLFQMCHTFYENLPDNKRPRTKYSSRRELSWPTLHSRMIVRTAGVKRGPGRSLTVQNIHCSEAAFYANPKVFTALLQTVPAHGNVFIESTANGESGDGKVYHDEYKRACGEEIAGYEDAEPSPFEPRFFAWYESSEYEKDIDPDEGFERTAEETSIVIAHDLDERFGAEKTDRKLCWRRAKKSEPGMGSLYAQEYPSNPEEAFLVSGQRFFTDWQPLRGGVSWHVVFEDEVEIQPHWHPLGAYDWGYGAPCCGGLGFVDDHGGIVVVDEVYAARLTDPEQADETLQMLKRWKLAPADVLFWADPSMWAIKTDNLGRKFQNVNAFHKLGLRFMKASNDRVPGWMNVRRYMHDTYTPKDRVGNQLSPIPYLRVVKGRCPNLIRTLPLMVHDKKKVEDVDTELEDHAPDMLRYLLGAKPRPSPEPKHDRRSSEIDAHRRAGLAGYTRGPAQKKRKL